MVFSAVIVIIADSFSSRTFILSLPLELSQCQEVEKRQGSSLAGWQNRIWVQMWLHCASHSKTHIKNQKDTCTTKNWVCHFKRYFFLGCLYEYIWVECCNFLTQSLETPCITSCQSVSVPGAEVKSFSFLHRKREWIFVFLFRPYLHKAHARSVSHSSYASHAHANLPFRGQIWKS